MAKKKCYVCNKSINESELTKIFGHNICKNCKTTYIKSNDYAKEKFTDDVWRLYTDKKPNFFQLKNQIEDFADRYGFTYQGMAYALSYWLKTNEYNQEYMLGQLFPQAYYEAKEHYIKQKKLKQSLQNTVIDKETEVVKATKTVQRPLLSLE